MKTPEEIKRGLDCCLVEDEDQCVCAPCPYAKNGNSTLTCDVEMGRDAVAYIQQLEQDNAQKDERIRKLEQRVPRWISVEERLPDKSHDWVLIIGKWESDGGWIVPHVAEYREGIWMTNGTGWNKIEDLHIKITHWMPLPEPPEEEKHETD